MQLTREQQQIIIERARDRIADPKHWRQDDYTATRDGAWCDVTDQSAYQSAYMFCAEGALIVEALNFCDGNFQDALAQMFRISVAICPGRSLRLVNDVSGHEAVLELFNKALAA